MANYWLPTRPFSLVDALNRAASAIGSCRTAAATSGASYNGHRVTVCFNTYCRARGWQAYYTWSGLRWLARAGSLETALVAAKREYDRGALGAEVIVENVEDPKDAALCEFMGFVLLTDESKAAHEAPWRTELHGECFHALSMQRQLGVPTSLLLDATPPTREAWNKLVDAYIQDRRHRRPKTGL